jgi:hypothetical protein
MQRWIIGLIILSIFLPVKVMAQADEVAFLSPVEQQILQGVVEVAARVAREDVLSFELLFAYSDETDERNLFLLAQGNALSTEQPLYRWDTTLIPDGDYRLILRVYFSNGEKREAILERVKVRNYSPVESPTASNLSLSTAPVMETPTQTPMPASSTPTPPGPNPGSIQPTQWTGSVLRGMAVSLLLFVVLGMYVSLRNRKKRR